MVWRLELVKKKKKRTKSYVNVPLEGNLEAVWVKTPTHNLVIC